jgi:hypothetical protein
MHRSRLSLGAVVAASLLLAGCGGGGDDEAAATTAAPEAAAEDAAGSADTSAPTTIEAPTSSASGTTAAPEATSDAATEAPEDGDGDTIFVSSFDEMPDECMSMLEDFLREVEPVVSQIDWATASSADLQTLFESNSDLFDGSTQMIPIAEEVAPGAVAWLTTMVQIISSAGGTGEPVAGAPATCDEAIAAIDAAIAEGKQLSNVPLAEMGTLTGALTVLAEDCTPEQLDAFYSREDVGEFLS